jgi:SAM-dependent methyltransferase
MTKPDTDARSDASWWEARYLSGDSPWDTGVVPPEVITLVESSGVSRGWALDLGCGSGVTSCYLATHGYRVVGIDLAREALQRGVARAATSALPCFFVRASAARLNFVHVRAALAIDIGCFHNLTPFERKSYIQSLAEHLQGGAHYLLYTFFSARLAQPGSDPSAASVVGPSDIAAFAPQFALLRAAHGQDRERPSAWFLMRRA